MPRRLILPNPQQEAAVREQAKTLLEAYSSFAKLTPEPYEPSTWESIKGLFRLSPAVPAEFDWRNHVEVPSAKFQGSCNSCTSFAAAAAIEIAIMIANSGEAPDVAAQHMHTCIVHRATLDINAICSLGIEPRRLLKLLTEYGYAVGLSDAAPFPPASCSTVAIHSTLPNFAVVPGSTARSSLTKGPIVTDMYIWDDFFDYTANRAPIYSPDMTLGQPSLHSVCVVGYTTQGWTIKNSFGPDWGDGTGFATIEKGVCGLLTDAPLPGLAQRPAYTLRV